MSNDLFSSGFPTINLHAFFSYMHAAFLAQLTLTDLIFPITLNSELL
jgi:hypothetical protein